MLRARWAATVSCAVRLVGLFGALGVSACSLTTDYDSYTAESGGGGVSATSGSGGADSGGSGSGGVGGSGGSVSGGASGMDAGSGGSRSDAGSDASTDADAGSSGAPGLVAHWRFDANGDDSSGFGNAAVPQPGATYSAAAQEGSHCLALDGVNGHAEVADASSLQLVTLSITAWVYFDEPIVNEWRAVVEHARDSDNWYGIYARNGLFQFRWGLVQTLNFKSTYQPGKWHHVAGVYDANVGTARVFLDGNLDEQFPNAMPPSKAAGKTLIGSAANGDEHIKGFIDDLRIYSRALSDAEVAAIANGSA